MFVAIDDVLPIVVVIATASSSGIIVIIATSITFLPSVH
jgi:hypothetical protein